MTSLTLVIECEIYARREDAESESISQAMFKAMRECIARGESWQDAMDRGDPPAAEERTNERRGKS
jgi:hypothetical protein